MFSDEYFFYFNYCILIIIDDLFLSVVLVCVFVFLSVMSYLMSVWYVFVYYFGRNIMFFILEGWDINYYGVFFICV